MHRTTSCAHRKVEDGSIDKFSLKARETSLAAAE